MRAFFGIFTLLFCVSTAFAQNALKPLPDGTKMKIEYSTDGKLSGFSNTPTWNKTASADAFLKRSPNGDMIEIKTASGYGFVVFLPSYFSHPITPNSAQAKITTDRATNSQINQGEKWQGKMDVMASVPVNWCADMLIKSEAKFEVLESLDQKLKIYGNDETLKVNPILEIGTWQRCYSARRTPRMLWSKELDIPISLEWVNWSIDKGLSSTAFKIEIKSIE